MGLERVEKRNEGEAAELRDKVSADGRKVGQLRMSWMEYFTRILEGSSEGGRI